MFYKHYQNDSVIGTMPSDPIYSDISCLSLFITLCLLPIAIFGLLNILQNAPYISLFVMFNFQIFCRTPVFFREMSPSDWAYLFFSLAQPVLMSSCSVSFLWHLPLLLELVTSILAYLPLEHHLFCVIIATAAEILCVFLPLVLDAELSPLFAASVDCPYIHYRWLDPNTSSSKNFSVPSS